MINSSCGANHFIYFKFLSLIFVLLVHQESFCRSIHRPIDPLCSMITTRWADDQTKTKYTLRDLYIQAPIFQTFDKKYFENHMLPSGPIYYRNNRETSVTGNILGELANSLVNEIKANKKKFSDFVVLKQRDYSSRDQSGLLIFKYKNYPFVLKLFIETPQGFIRPYAKGFEPTCFFIMGGSMRHLTGFTRVKNLELIDSKLKSDPFWNYRVDLPRKWFWQPNNNRWLEVKTTNVGQTIEQSTQFPAVYGVICDLIEVGKNFSLCNKNHRKFCMDLMQFLDFSTDPHLKNFIIEKGIGKVVIIDTEFFPLLVGLKKKIKTKSYSSWYLKLAGKFFTNRLMLNKKERKLRQLSTTSEYRF